MAELACVGTAYGNLVRACPIHRNEELVVMAIDALGMREIDDEAPVYAHILVGVESCLELAQRYPAEVVCSIDTDVGVVPVRA